MGINYPDRETYYALYERFQKRPPDELFEYADINGKTVLDLCGGDGQLSELAFKNGANVTYVDHEPEMLGDISSEIIVHHQDVCEFISKTDQKYDVVFCRQAINYWLPDVDIAKLASCSDILIFNTFLNDPGPEKIRKYTHDNVEFLEITRHVGNRIWHKQSRTGYSSHETWFYWISEEKYFEILSPWFHVELIENGTTATFICQTV